VPCEVLLLPGYIDKTNALGELVSATTMSHGDRIRVSPISGCTLDCRFCDLPALRYTRHSAEQMLASSGRGRTGPSARHLLISGDHGAAHSDGSPTLSTVIGIRAADGRDEPREETSATSAVRAGRRGRLSLQPRGIRQQRALESCRAAHAVHPHMAAPSRRWR
jgi:hypothetical protein